MADLGCRRYTLCAVHLEHGSEARRMALARVAHHSWIAHTDLNRSAAPSSARSTDAGALDQGKTGALLGRRVGSIAPDVTNSAAPVEYLCRRLARPRSCYTSSSC